MKLKFSDLQSFSNSYSEIKDEKMSINLAFQLSQISKAVSECMTFYQEKASHYFEQYAEKDGDNYKLSTANSIIKTRYNFFEESNIPNQSIWTKQDLEITESLLQTDANFNNYTPVMVDGCEKVTSITGSKSNRFNLIQSLCEAFECWAKFTIDHDEIGRTIYEYSCYKI